MNNQVHRTPEGLTEEIAIKAALNLWLPEKLKAAFPSIVPITRPTFSIPEGNLDKNWVSGFTEGDWSFFCSISGKTGQVRCFFKIGLNERETPLLNKIQEFFWGIGVISFAPKTRATYYTVADRGHLVHIILAHFKMDKLAGNKLPNFIIWSKILTLVIAEAHKTPKG